MLGAMLVSWRVSLDFWQGGFGETAPDMDRSDEHMDETDAKMFWFENHKFSSSWWFQIFLYVHPYFGEDSQFDDHIFQMGWFNHQPVIVCILFSYLLKRDQSGLSKARQDRCGCVLSDMSTFRESKP